MPEGEVSLSPAKVISVDPTQQDTSILDTIKADQGAKLLETAQQQFPYLAGKDIGYKYTPTPNEERKLEFYQGEDIPDWAKGRAIAIEVFNPNTRPIDILADYASHYGVNQDPKLQELYQKFQNQLNPTVMQERYKYHRENLREKRPYEQWYQMTGLPEIFRGYPFKQWGSDEEAKQMYTPEQINTLNQVRSYLGIK